MVYVSQYTDFRIAKLPLLGGTFRGAARGASCERLGKGLLRVAGSSSGPAGRGGWLSACRDGDGARGRGPKTRDVASGWLQGRGDKRP